MNMKAALEKRLSSYWKMEIGNIILVPLCMIILAFTSGSPVGWVSYLTMVPMCGLLLVGGFYWRGKHSKLNGDPSHLGKALKLAHWTQFPLLILTVFACGLTIFAFVFPGHARGTGDLFVAASAAILAALEYVNYYHRQIQHFDHKADFKRLFAGQGFRRSQMSQDLRRWRGRQTTSPTD